MFLEYMDGHAHANINRDLQDSREYFLHIPKTCSKFLQPQSIGINKI